LLKAHNYISIVHHLKFIKLFLSSLRPVEIQIKQKEGKFKGVAAIQTGILVRERCATNMPYYISDPNDRFS
jgi:hypothetical protein